MTNSTTREIPFGRPAITDEDRQRVADVLNGHILTHGPECQAFEAEFADFMGGGYAVSTNSGMTALHLAYFYFEIGPGDEVLVPAQTHIATVHAVELTGATPVFVDCDPTTGNMDLSQLEALITPRTRAVSVVHFNGIPVAMDQLTHIAQQHDLRIVEDCALAVGARYQNKHVGLWGDVGCYSFYPVKHLTTGEGGMYVTQHEHIAVQSAKLRAHGVDRKHDERSLPGNYDVPYLGPNYRMSELQAALGRGQIQRLAANIETRRQNFNRLRDGLLSAFEGDIVVLDAQSPNSESSFYCLSVVLKDEWRSLRDDLIRSLREQGVGTSIYYPRPVPEMSYYANKYKLPAGQYPNAARISYGSVALPVAPHVDTADIDYIIERFSYSLKGLLA